MIADEMPIGKTFTFAQTESFRSTATRVSEEMVEIIYFDQRTNDETLKFLARVDGTSSELVQLDRVYWTVSVNGRAATEADLQDLIRKPKLGIEIDGVGRTISVSLN